MNFLVRGKRPGFLTLFLIVIMVGITYWKSNPRREYVIAIPSPNVANQSDRPIKSAIPLAARTPNPAITALPGRAVVQETSQVITATVRAATLDLVPTLTTLADPISDTLAATANLPSLTDFVRQVSDGRKDLVRGIYVSGVMALRVVPQPQDDPGFISAEDGTATLFQSASVFGVTGLLAHNFLSGREFFRLKTGQTLSVIYGDGHIRHYKVSQIEDLQRLSFDDLRSNFLELSSGVEKTANQLFADFYQGQPHLTLQTCIERDGEWTWGVRFIRAEPVD